MHRNAFANACVVSLGLLAAACQAQTVISAPRTFPIVIDQPGSYVLGSNLVVPAQTHGIKILAANVVLDLKGFTIKGPSFCGTYCPPAGLAAGVWIGGGSATVRNGTITGFDSSGVYFINQQVLLEDLVLTDNLMAGVQRAGLPTNVGSGSMPAVLRRVTASRNAWAGVYGYGMRIEDTTLMQNFGHGMVSQGFNTYYATLFSQNKTYGYASAYPNANSDAMRDSRFQGNGTAAVWGFTPASMGGNHIDGQGTF